MRSVVGVAVVLTVAALSLLVLTLTGGVSCGDKCAHHHEREGNGNGTMESTPWGRMQDENGKQIRMMLRVNKAGIARAVPYEDDRENRKSRHHNRHSDGDSNDGTSSDQEETTQYAHRGWKHHSGGYDHPHPHSSDHMSFLFVLIYVLKNFVGLLFCHLTAAVTSPSEKITAPVKRRVLVGCVIGHAALTGLYSMSLFSPEYLHGYRNWCLLVRFSLSLLLASAHGILSMYCLVSFSSAAREKDEEEEDLEKNGGEDKVSLLSGKDVFPLLPFGSPLPNQDCPPLSYGKV